MARFRFPKNSLLDSVSRRIHELSGEASLISTISGMVPEDGTYVSKNSAMFIKNIPQGVATYVFSIARFPKHTQCSRFMFRPYLKSAMLSQRLTLHSMVAKLFLISRSSQVY